MTSKNNMLSVNNVRIHGFADKRWTKADQMLQYKGLVKLYKRDRKIINVDVGVAARKQKFELKALKRGIENSRNQLQQVIVGDKQETRNALAEHKRMQLAYQELPTLQVIDHIYQNNFTKRKQLDMLKYRTKMQTQILVDLKLSKAIWEDRIKYQQTIVPEAKIAERITGKVQDAILKKEAALVVRQAYVNIIDIMKKDALYYDAILEDLRKDGKIQGQCMIRATQLGQLAMEYLDDRKAEFKELEVTVKRDMKQRLEDLRAVSHQMEEIQGNMKFLIRKDSDINCALVVLPPQYSNKDLANEIEQVEQILSKLERIAMVTNFESIYNSLSEQLRQKYRLEELHKKKSQDHDALLNKLDHAKCMKSMLENNVLDTTNFYIAEKTRIAEALAEQHERKRETEKLIKKRSKLLAVIDTSLKQLDSMCDTVNDDGAKTPFRKDQVPLPSGEMLFRVRCPDPGEFDGRKIIDGLVPKIQKLIAVASQISKDLQIERETEALMAYGGLVARNRRFIEIGRDVLSEDSLFDDLATFDATFVPTREEIKKISAAIYKECSVDPDLLPVIVKK